MSLRIVAEESKRSIVTEDGKQFAFFPVTEFSVEQAREHAAKTLKALTEYPLHLETITKIRGRLAGEWEIGSLEDDIQRVLKELEVSIA